MITHYDLFAGIGGFSLALEEVFGEKDIKHIFCEWEFFPTAVLKRHWPDGEFWGDIADLVTDTDGKRLEDGRIIKEPAGQSRPSDDFTIVTGGFPCQPFSHAGRRKGTADDRYQWPNMLKVIRNVSPEWVIAENVRGLVTWNDGMVLETVCTDLEAEGYEVQPFVIPAVAVGAPHRRDRVWIIAHAIDDRPDADTESDGRIGGLGLERKPEPETAEQRSSYINAPDTQSQRDGRGSSQERRDEREDRVMESNKSEGRQIRRESKRRDRNAKYPDWNRTWQEVAFATCDDSVDDGIPRIVDGVSYSRAKWRKNSIKAYGNAIVPEVATQIVKAIREAIE